MNNDLEDGCIHFGMKIDGKLSVKQWCAGCAVVMDDDVHGFAKDHMETHSEPVNMRETVENNMVMKIDGNVQRRICWQ